MPTVFFANRQYEVRPGESVLEALIRGGAEIQFSCRKGACQVCMMRTLEGEVPGEAKRHLRPELAETGHFLPCQTHLEEDLKIAPPDLAMVSFEAIVSEKKKLSPKVVALYLEPEINLEWKPGQYLDLIRPDGTSRNYSIASIAEEDYFLVLHVKRVEGGEVSTWIHDELQAGEIIRIQGPLGDCHYRPDEGDRPMILLGTGTGIAPLYGILRDALRQNHQGEIEIYHGVADPQELYLDEELRALASAHSNLSYFPVVSDLTVRGDWANGRVTDLAFAELRDCKDFLTYLCGNPDMVYDGRYQAVGAGVKRADIRADPFESDIPYWPQDREKIANTPRDPELWAALEEGKKLREILEDFYTQVYADPRLSPFFHNSTKLRAVSKQHEFLANIFHGENGYFGLNPFNAHHWMIISDELFDYREDLFEACLRKHGLQEHLIRRWMAFQELFRREMVKSRERGLIMNGVENLKTGYSLETLSIGALCDGCQSEIPPDGRGWMHQRTGELFCLQCHQGD